MKKSRIFNVFTQGIVRHQSAESAAEGSAADVVGFRYRDGALRPFGDPLQLFVSEQPVVATDKLFHPLLPYGEFLYRIGQSIYWWHRRDVEVILNLERDEIFTSWIVFGISVIISTSKYTRVIVYNENKWISIKPLANKSSISISNNPANGVDFTKSDSALLMGNCNNIYLEKSEVGDVKHIYNPGVELTAMEPVMRSNGMISGMSRMVACLKLTDGNTICISTPYHVQFGISKHKYTSPNSVLSDNDGVAVAYNLDAKIDYVFIMAGPLYCIPELDISVDDDIINFINSMSGLNMIHSLSIYSTRKFELIDINKTWRDYNSIENLPYIYKSSSPGANKYTYAWYASFSEIDIAEPYYLLKDIEISNVTNNFKITIKPDDFSNITAREILKPNGTRHIISTANYMMDYNSRLHGCGINTIFSSGDNPIAQAKTTTVITPVSGYMNYIANPISGLTFHTEVDIMADGQVFTVGRKVDGCLYKQTVADYLTGGTTIAHYLLLNSIVAYPDARAIRMRVVADMDTVETPASSESDIDITTSCFTSILLSTNYPSFSRYMSLEDSYRHSIAVIVSFTSKGVNHTSNTLRSSIVTYDSNVDAVTNILLSDIAAQLGSWISTLNIGYNVTVTSTYNRISISATGGILSVYGFSASGYNQPPFVTIINSKVDGSVNQSASYLAADIPLKQSLETNISYSVGTVQTNVSPPIHAFLIPKKADDVNQPDLSKLPIWTPLSAIKHKTLHQSNRLQVWAYGSPIFYDLKNSYRIGGQFENLLQVETTVDQMSEGRFGQYPLYCFTDRGLYALEQGADGSVLYASSYPISADSLLSTGGVTPLSGAVAFTSGRGVLAVSGRQVIDLSRPIVGFKDSVAEFYDNTEELLTEYLADAKLFRIYSLNELIVYNKQYNYAYVYNMDGKMWTRRQISGEIQRSNSRLLLCEQSSTQLKVYNLEKETLSNSNRMLYISRPLEFGNNGYKKVEQAIARLTEQVQGSSVTMTIWGSIDGVNYAVIQRASSIDMQTSSIRAGRSGVSVRYVIIVIECSKDVYTTLNQIDFEVEDRYNSKLR